MSNFDNDTLASIPGNTPREKFVCLQKMIALLEAVAYPRRGTAEENLTLQDVSDQAAKLLPSPQ